MYRVTFAGLAAALLISPAAAQAQEGGLPPASIPRLAERSADIAGFTPPGFAVEVYAQGDLDGDGDEDVVGVLRGQDPALILDNDGLGEDRLDTNPRILFVAFAEPGGGYRLAAQNSTLIPRREEPVQSDPFEPEGGLNVSGRTIRVKLDYFLSAGGWGMFYATYTFRWQNERLEMIGYDRTDIQRNTGELDEVSINYSTGKAKISKGSIENDERQDRWVTVPRRRLSIDEVGDGLMFESGVGGE